MTTLRMLAAVLAAAFVLAAGPAQAEMKTQWVEYSHANASSKAIRPTTTRSPASVPPS